MLRIFLAIMRLMPCRWRKSDTETADHTRKSPKYGEIAYQPQSSRRTWRTRVWPYRCRPQSLPFTLLPSTFEAAFSCFSLFLLWKVSLSCYWFSSHSRWLLASAALATSKSRYCTRPVVRTPRRPRPVLRQRIRFCTNKNMTLRH